MPEHYFSKFPTVFYANVEVRDITRRVKLDDSLRNKPTIFYPYEIRPGLRADLLADAYYGDPYYDWLIYLTNEIVDPYYGWYLDQYDFEKFILEKYGSVEYAQEHIKFWRIDWEGVSEQEITASYYENHLPYALKKYYEPQTTHKGAVLAYRRKQEDWVVNTNKIVSFTITDDATFEADEILDIRFGGETVGNGQIITANATTLLIQHVVGNTHANSTHTPTLVGETSAASSNSNASETLHEVISSEEFVYWASVNFYDWETEENEKKKLVALLDSNYALDAAEELRVKLKAT